MTNKPAAAPDEEIVEEVAPLRKPSPMGSTFAERAAARQAQGKQVDDGAAENKAVSSSASTKSRKYNR